jgi:hypothetical protein
MFYMPSLATKLLSSLAFLASAAHKFLATVFGTAWCFCPLLVVATKEFLFADVLREAVVVVDKFGNGSLLLPSALAA